MENDFFKKKVSSIHFSIARKFRDISITDLNGFLCLLYQCAIPNFIKSNLIMVLSVLNSYGLHLVFWKQ